MNIKSIRFLVLASLHFVGRPAVLAFALVLCTVQNAVVLAQGAQQPQSENFVTVPYSFPDYDQALAKTGIKDYAGRDEYVAALADKRFEFRKVKYKSDGLMVVAYVYEPVAPGYPLPVIIFNRGSAIRSDIAPELIVFFHRLAEGGFIVVAPLLRQSDGSEGTDEIGGRDVDDIVNLVPMIDKLDRVDKQNLFMYGESRGGMMTYQAIKRGVPIRAGAVFGAFTDMRELVESHPQQYPRAALVKMFDGFETNSERIFESRSAINWASELKTPILIMHGGGDWSVNPMQSLKLAEKLQSLGKSYELIVYAGDDHTISHNEIDRDRRAVEWFRSHMVSGSSGILPMPGPVALLSAEPCSL